MSSLLNYIKDLPVVFDRRNVLNALAELRDEYNDTLAPNIQPFKEWYDTDPELKKLPLVREYFRQVKSTVNMQGDPVSNMFDTLDDIAGYFDVLINEIRTLFSIQFTNTNISYRRAYILNFVDALSFYVRYARKFMMYLVTQTGGLTPLTKADREFIESNLKTFADLYMAMGMGPNELKTKLQQVPDAEINQETDALAGTVFGLGKLDPALISHFSPQSNPFIFMGKLLAEYQHKRYQLAKEEYFFLQLKLQEYREKQQGNSTLTLQKTIKAYEDRINQYEYEISKYEDRIRNA